MKSYIRTSNLMASVAMMAAIDAGFSLNDMADMVTDDIKELDSLLMPAGVYAVKVTQAMLGQNDAKEGLDDNGEPYPPLFYLQRKYEVLELNPLDKTVDADKYVGRTINDRFTFWPADFQDRIGLLKGDYKRVGLANSGRMGGLEGGEPGWIDGAVESMIGLKCKHVKKASGDFIAVYNWFKLDDPNSEAEADAALAAA
jgi:hypothetical protein